MSNPQQQQATEVNGAGPPRSPLLRGDDLVGGVILFFCAATYAITTTFEEVPAMLSQGIQPSVFPRALIAVIAILSMILIVQGRRKPASVRKPVPIVAFATAGLLGLFVAAIDWVGMMIAIFLFCLVLPALWGDRRYFWITIFAVLFPAGIFILFSKMLEVRFPLGILQSFGF
jgi:hypothetical protein